MDPLRFLRGLAYWLRSDEGRIGAVHADDKDALQEYTALVASFQAAFSGSWDGCVLVLETIVSSEGEQHFNADGQAEAYRLLHDVIYQVVKIHTKYGEGKPVREAYFSAKAKSNRSTLGTCSLTGETLGRVVLRVLHELVAWNINEDI